MAWSFAARLHLSPGPGDVTNFSSSFSLIAGDARFVAVAPKTPSKLPMLAIVPSE